MSGHPGGVRTKAIAGSHDRSQSGLQHFLCTRFLGRPTLDLSKSSGWDTGGYMTLPPCPERREPELADGADLDHFWLHLETKHLGTMLAHSTPPCELEKASTH